jgi:hypothetical protein
LCHKVKAFDGDLGLFWIILCGTDQLEMEFGHLRTFTAGDSNMDVLQLSSRLASSTECSIILAQYPEWNGAPR